MDWIFEGPGEMRALCRAFNWSATALGPVDRWPQSLRTAAQMVLASPFPNIILWGNDLIQLYNDGYRDLMGNKHPEGLGRPTQLVWPEVWHINYPIYERVRQGESFSFEDALYPLARSGQQPEDVWLTLAYSPVLEETGKVGGILVTVFDTTDRVLEQQHRLRAQQALRESELRFSRLLKATSEIVYSMNAGWTAMLQLDGKDYLESSSTVNYHWMDHYIPQAEQKRVWGFIQLAIRQQTPFEAEHQVVRRDGSTGWVNSRAIPIPDDEGRIVEWVGAATDITARKLIEHQQAYLLRLSDTLRTLTDTNSIQEQAARCLGCELGVSRAFYFVAEEADGSYVHIVSKEYYSRPDIPAVIGQHPQTAYGRSVYARLATGESLVVNDIDTLTDLTDTERQRYNKLLVRSMIVVPLVKNGRYVAAFAVNDVRPRQWTAHEIRLVEETAERTWAAVERATAEKALSISEERLLRAINTARTVVWEWNVPENKIETTSNIAEVYGYPAMTFAEQGYSLVHDEDRESHLQKVRRAATTGGGYYSRFRIIHPDSQGIVWLEERADSIQDENGNVIKLVGAAIDITEIKYAEEALRKADHRKNEFLAMLAHELRNPMSTIRSGLQILSMTGETDVIRPAVAMMNRQTDHLVRLVDDLLDVSRISRGTIELRKSRLNLVSLIEHAMPPAKALCDERSHTLSVLLPSTPVFLDGDETRLTQVVTNLLTNAARYTPPGGQISLRLVQNGQQAVVEVTDNGIGLTSEQLGSVFELFMQVDNSLARTQGGLGLGLTLVRQLVELHGGKVSARSGGLGQGSTFTVILPTLPGADESAAGLLPEQPAVAAGCRVLVVDDNTDAALTLSMLLSMKGYETCTENSGRAGIDTAGQIQPDVILLDIGMPEMDGYQTCRLIRQQPWGMNLFIIALTGYGQAADRQRTKEAGFDGHLVKPVNMTELDQLIHRLQQRRT